MDFASVAAAIVLVAAGAAVGVLVGRQRGSSTGPVAAGPSEPDALVVAIQSLSSIAKAGQLALVRAATERDRTGLYAADPDKGAARDHGTERLTSAAGLARLAAREPPEAPDPAQRAADEDAERAARNELVGGEDLYLP